MTLTFTQSSDQSFGGVPAYEAEFEVTGNFAIHIERTRGDAALILKQRTGGGKYALVDDFNYAKSKGEVLDYEASVAIPKYIKIVSEVEPTLAEIVTDGEVTEIKSQSKVVEITNNGTTEVIPDSGFAYLSKVNIKTNVPQSGGGSGEGGSGGGIEYIDVSGMDSSSQNFQGLTWLSYLIKGIVSTSGGSMGIVLPAAMALKYGEMYSLVISAIAIDTSTEVIESGRKKTVKDVVYTNMSESDYAALPRISKESFYTF